MKVIYICGPFTATNAWDIEQNIRRAEEVAYEVAKLGAAPLCPHANSRFFHGTMTPEFWYLATAELMRRCDAVMRLPGWQVSRGAGEEVEEAVRGGMPVFDFISDLRLWLLKANRG